MGSRRWSWEAGFLFLLSLVQSVTGAEHCSARGSGTPSAEQCSAPVRWLAGHCCCCHLARGSVILNRACFRGQDQDWGEQEEVAACWRGEDCPTWRGEFHAGSHSVTPHRRGAGRDGAGRLLALLLAALLHAGLHAAGRLRRLRSEKSFVAAGVARRRSVRGGGQLDGLEGGRGPRGVPLQGTWDQRWRRRLQERSAAAGATSSLM